ncbi:hypothetical protein [Polyangium sp. y55x31]|uniref:hypothetical protein n=1 Tax=Polyangium sp. y55x31 TaxID=3042688 RepID=UPI002482EAAF|nr:hypothetical protein [Polyangium sp. y55x31]MDI1482572.1 hypothetical protein [Polyangium sp. y55x31]
MSERLPALDSGRAVVSKDDRSSGRSQNDVVDMTRALRLCSTGAAAHDRSLWPSRVDAE